MDSGIRISLHGEKNLESVQGEVATIFNLFFFFFSLADRSFNDLTQYPVFPWILADYKSEELGKMSLIKRWFRLNILATI